MTFECILYEKGDGLATVKLNRPKVLNAMNKQLWLEFQGALEDAGADPEVKVLKDVSFRVLPISLLSARKMMGEIRATPLLDGFRGLPPYDKAILSRLLVQCSDIVEAYPEIEEMDLNPVIVFEKGASILDARIILKEEAQAADHQKDI